MQDDAKGRLNKLYASRYELLELLGEGGMGAVYRAKHKFTGGEVALKVMHAGVVRSEQAQGRFLREAQAPKTISHPGIVKVSDAGVAEDGSLYLAMELLEGEDLSEALDRRPLNALELGAVVSELLDCLSAAHASGLVHRDIKPENVFLVRGAPEGNRVKLLDFGITKQLDEERNQKLTQTGLVIGTPHYMSPEQAQGDSADARSDLYSVGALMFFGLTGRPPFLEENYNRLIIALATEPAPKVQSVRADVPPDLAAVVDRTLEMDPDDRFQTAAEMRAALASCSGLERMEAPTIHSIGYEATLASGAELGRPSASGLMHASIPIARTLATPAGAYTGPLEHRADTDPRVVDGPASTRRTAMLTAGVLVVALLGGAIAFTQFGGSRAVDGSVEAQQSSKTTPTEPAVAEMDAATPPQEAANGSGEVEQVEAPGEPPEPALEERLRELEEQLAASNREKKEQRIAQRRRVRQQREESAAAGHAQRSSCLATCQMELGTCQRQSGGRGKAASDCHMQWLSCRSRCPSGE